MAGRLEEIGEPGAASGLIAGPLVSIVTATYNASATLAACLASVRAQDYPHIEHILVDGGSKDSTVDVLREHDGEIAKWISEPDRGIYDAWNKGLKLARGEWIAFVGADDVLLPGAISSYMELAAKHPEAQYLSGHVRWIGPGGKPEIIGEPWRWPRFLRFMCTAHVGSMHRRSLFEQYGEYDISYRIVGDYELLLRARGNLRAAFMDRVTAQMQCGGASDSAAALDEAARAQQQAGGRSAWMVGAARQWARAKFFGRRARRRLFTPSAGGANA